MNILITGDSHLAAIDRALVADSTLAKSHKIHISPLGNSEASHKPYFKDGDNCVEITLSRFKKHLDCLPPKGEKTDVIAVSMLFHTLRFLRQSRLWSGFAPASLGKLEFHSLTQTTFRRMVLAQQQYNLELLRKLQKFIPNVIALEGPKVFSHHPALEKGDHGILMEVDRQYRSVIKAELNELNITVVECPTETYSKETGFMKPQYRPKRVEDNHHASTEFGGLILKKLVETIESSKSHPNLKNYLST